MQNQMKVLFSFLDPCREDFFCLVSNLFSFDFCHYIEAYLLKRVFMVVPPAVCFPAQSTAPVAGSLLVLQVPVPCNRCFPSRTPQLVVHGVHELQAPAAAGDNG